MVALNFFVFAHSPWPATFSVQSVGRFGKSKFNGFRYAPRVHHVIVPPDFGTKEGCFCVWFRISGEPPSQRGVGCHLGVFPTREGPKGQDRSFLSALPLLRIRPLVRSPCESNPKPLRISGRPVRRPSYLMIISLQASLSLRRKG
jgi:hypothetical protein